MILVDVSKVVKVTVFLRHGDQVAVLNRRFFRGLSKEFWVYVGDIGGLLGLGNKWR